MNTPLQIDYRTMALEYVQTREQWLERAAEIIRESLIPQLAAFRAGLVVAGYTRRRLRGRPEGWGSVSIRNTQPIGRVITCSSRRRCRTRSRSWRLAHELVHVAAGPNAGHKGAFVKIAKPIGFKAPWTTTPATPELTVCLNGLLVNLGPYPHAAIDKRGRKKQGTRLLKVIAAPVDTRFGPREQCIDIGLPTCVCGAEMKLGNEG